MANTCGNLFPTDAGVEVAAQFDRLKTLTDTGLQKAYTALDAMSGPTSPIAQGLFQPPPFSFATPPNRGGLPGAIILDIPTPTLVNPGTTIDGSKAIFGDTIPDFSLSPANLRQSTVGEAPAAPILQNISPPSALDSTLRPGAPPTVGTVRLPSAPTLTFPDLPGLDTLTLPRMPAINIDGIVAEFRALLAQMPSVPPLQNVDWWGAFNTASGIVANYSGFAVAGEPLTALLQQHATGIPPAVEQALRDRAYRDVDEQAYRAEQQVLEDWSTRGFTLPGGALAMRLDEVRQKGQDAKQTLARDIFVQAAEWEIKNLQFAVQQGIQYEGQLRQHYLAVFDLRRQIATDATTAFKATAELVLAAFSAQVERVKAGVGFLGAWSQLELSKLEAFKAEIQGEIAKGELNKAKVELFTAQHQGLMTQVSVYKTQVEASLAELEVGKQNLEVYKAHVSAYGEVVKAWSAEWSGFSEQVRAESTKSSIYESQVRAWSERLKADAVHDQSVLAIGDLELKHDQVSATLIDAKVKAFIAQLDHDKTLYGAELDRYKTNAAIFSTSVQSQATAAGLVFEGGKLQLESSRISLMEALDRYKIAVSQTQAEASIKAQLLDSVGKITSTLAAGAMAAQHVSAGISNSFGASQGSSCSTSYNYAL